MENEHDTVFVCVRSLKKPTDVGAWSALPWRWSTCMCPVKLGGYTSHHATDKEIEIAHSFWPGMMDERYARIAVYGQRRGPDGAQVLSVGVISRDGYPEVDRFVSDPLNGLVEFLGVKTLFKGEYDLWETIITTGRTPPSRSPRPTSSGSGEPCPISVSSGYATEPSPASTPPPPKESESCTPPS